MSRDTTITAVVERVRHRKADSGWCILATDLGCAKGVVAWEPKTGERLRLVGSWTVSKFNGQEEFSFASAMLDVDMDPRALLHYAVTQTDGLGEAKEAAIWTCYGAGWQDVPELCLIDGITLKARENWARTLVELRTLTAKMQAFTWLLAHGCSDTLAAGAWAKWEEQTIGVVSHDPYALAELPHHGWAAVDVKVARPYFGIAPDDPRRVDAGVLHLMRQSDGDTLLRERLLIANGVTIGLAPELVAAALDRLDNADEPKIFRFGGVRPEVALLDDYAHEKAAWNRFGKVAAG